MRNTDKRLDKLKKLYTEEDVTNDDNKYIIYCLDALLKNNINQVKAKKLLIDIKEFNDPLIECTKSLIVRLITPQLMDLNKIVEILDFWIQKRTEMYFNPDISRIKHKNITDITEVSDLILYIRNI